MLAAAPMMLEVASVKEKNRLEFWRRRRAGGEDLIRSGICFGFCVWFCSWVFGLGSGEWDGKNSDLEKEKKEEQESFQVFD